MSARLTLIAHAPTAATAAAAFPGDEELDARGVTWCTAGTTHDLGSPEEAVRDPRFRLEYLGPTLSARLA